MKDNSNKPEYPVMPMLSVSEVFEMQVNELALQALKTIVIRPLQNPSMWPETPNKAAA